MDFTTASYYYGIGAMYSVLNSLTNGRVPGKLSYPFHTGPASGQTQIQLEVMNLDQDMYDAFRKIGRDGMGVELTNEQIDHINARIIERLEEIHPYRYCYTCERACDRWKTCQNYNGGD